MGFLRARIIGGYGARYEEGSVREYVAAFSDSLSEEELSRIVAHFDRTVDMLVVEEPPLFLDDDDIALEGANRKDSDREGGRRDVGEMSER